MLVISIIVIIISLFAPLIYGWFHRDEWGVGGDIILGYTIAVPFAAVAIIFGIVPLVQLYTGEKTYTGYIYSAEDEFNRTVGRIRFSENAGADEQPSFCVVKGSAESQQLKELAGSGKKVRVTVPSGFVVQMWYGQCGLPANIKLMEEVKNNGTD